MGRRSGVEGRGRESRVEGASALVPVGDAGLGADRDQEKWLDSSGFGDWILRGEGARAKFQTVPFMEKPGEDAVCLEHLRIQFWTSYSSCLLDIKEIVSKQLDI